ncbi:MAG: methyltransferase domain-containing protein [Candidatus Lokiarchaeota archaeon]|nr:methyltransferase domain-containing protein [Candidatus Lokiarchaeota archaeon]
MVANQEESWKETYNRQGDIWRSMYPRGYSHFKGLQALLDYAEPDMHLLDIGIGTGEAALPFLKKGLRVTGIDISQRALELCRAKFSNEEIPESQFDLREVSLQEFEYHLNEYDIVIDYYTSQHVGRNDQKRFFQSVAQLRSGSFLLVGQFSPTHLKTKENFISKGNGIFVSENRFFCVRMPDEMSDKLRGLEFEILKLISYEEKGFYEVLATKG